MSGANIKKPFIKKNLRLTPEADFGLFSALGIMVNEYFAADVERGMRGARINAMA